MDFLILDLYVPGTDAFLSIRHISYMYVVAVESTGACMYTRTSRT